MLVKRKKGLVDTFRPIGSLYTEQLFYRARQSSSLFANPFLYVFFSFGTEFLIVVVSVYVHHSLIIFNNVKDIYIIVYIYGEDFIFIFYSTYILSPHQVHVRRETINLMMLLEMLK